MIVRSTATILLLVLAVLPARAQQGREVHLDTLDAHTAQPFQLEPIVLPGSERVLLDGAPIDTSRYRLDYRYARLWIDDLAGADTVIVTYRTLPFRLQDLYRRHEPVAGAAPERAPPPAASEPLLPTTSRLQHSGSITRGILAGNNRDVTVESGLRMQLSGEIADGVEVQAVLTDENTPILPEGTTQRIDEFDRVFIGLDAPFGSAQLGDFDLRFADSEFGQFDRKLQGASATAPLPAMGALAGGSVTAAGATTRGLYREQEIEPIDGVQGPYRLEGARGEQFVLVVPGSETVYVDGQALTRGETNDYTIDYATAEISFTPSIIVTEDRRIRVEFQYSTTQFTRTLVGSQVETHLWPTDDGPRARLGVSFLREADSRDFSEEFGFSRTDSLALIGAGDGIAASGGAERVTFDPEAAFVQYRREIRNGTDTVFVAIETTPEPGEPVFRVQFSRVGEGLGAYERVGRAVNGIVYRHVGPGAGSYLPVRILPKPMRRQLVDLHGAVEPLRGVELFGEWARTAHDENRLSPLDADDDLGGAYLAGIRLVPSAIGPARVSAQIRRRAVDASFAPFNRIRPVEFERRWNLPARTAAVGVDRDETIDEADVRIDLLHGSAVQGELGRIFLGDVFEGVRRAGHLTVDEAALPVLDYAVEVIDSRDAEREGRWIRQLGQLSYPIAGTRLTPRLEIEHEDRRHEITGLDSLARPSFRFVELRPGVAWEAEALELGAFVERRTEDDWIDGSVQPAATSWTGQSTFRYRPSSTVDVDGSAGFRSRRFSDRFRIEQNRQDVESLILRLNGGYRPLQRALQLNVLYEGMTERTPTLQEIYVRTGPEIGQYVWEDDNGDGVVQIDEMVPERLPHEGTYVKTFIPSDTLTSVVNVQSRIRVEFDPARLWSSADTPLQRWLSQVSTRSVLEVREKTRDPDLTGIYLLNLSRFRDPRFTMNGRLRVAQDVFLFRSQPNYGIDLSFSQLRSLSDLAAGEEERFVNSWRVDGRLRAGERWGFRTIAAVEQDRLLSASFASRRYDISGLRVEPEASYAVSDRMQIVAAPAFARKDDTLGGRRARIVRLPVELRYTRPRKLQATARAEVAHVGLDGDALGLARFELTDGRGPGTSYMWTLNGQYTLSEYLRATFSYDGRAPASAPVIHTMQIQLSAMF